MISFVHFDNKEKYIFLIFGKGPTQGLDTTLTTEISIQFQKTKYKILFKPALSWEQQFLIC